MLDKVIRTFTEQLHSLSPLVLRNQSLTQEIHWWGINCRQLGMFFIFLYLIHAGRIRSCLPPSPFKSSYILVEICARSAKNQLRENLREYTSKVNKITIFYSFFKSYSDSFHECVRLYINKLLFDTEYWKNTSSRQFMKGRIQQEFPNALTDDEFEEDFDLRQSLFPLFHDVFLI